MSSRWIGAPFASVMLIVLVACSGSEVAEDATGEEIYLQVCASCHGGQLEGGTGVALVGEEARSIGRPERYFVQSISSGIGRMPSFRGTLSEEQILRVTRYIMEQQERQPDHP